MIATTARELTPRQAAVYGFVRSVHAATGRPPTYRDIADRFGMSGPTGVLCHLEALAKKGYLRRPNKYEPRGWVPIAPPGCCACCFRPLEESA